MRFFLIRLTLALLCVTGSQVAQAAWHEARSNHFIIYANEKPETIRAFTERLERFDQAVRQLRRMPDPPLTDAARLKIFVVKDQYSVERLAGGSGVLGFYIPQAAGSVAFVPARAGAKGDKWDIDAETVFFHEYAHHLQLQSADLALPPWVTEGFAEFFGRTQLRDDGSVLLGVPPAYRAYALTEYDELSLQEMLGAETRLNDMEWEGIYGKGWLLTHYLTFNRDRRGQLDRYVAGIQKGIPPLTAAQQAFGNLNTLTGELAAYLRKSKLPHLVLTSGQIRTGAISIRPLSPGAGEMMPVHMRSERGAGKKTKHAIAADARRVAARYPGDAFVQAALAQAEFDADNFAAAEAAADRALAANPNSLPALIYKGRSQAELARKSAGAADWAGIRTWFVKANKADLEAAEPLVEFYKTYTYSGTTPTKNAVNGLVYALALAPQDSGLRLLVVRQFLRDRQMADARRYFAPYAFEAHSRRANREAAAKASAAIASGQVEQALAQIDKLEELLKDDR
jgi:tetratricopeptide (TPR) repeat protein